MDEARRLHEAGAARRTWIVADRQEAGRGRGDRSWRSPPGNLHLTLLTPTRAAPRDQPKLGFVAGVALADAAVSLLPAAVDIRLKWPNDLLLDGGKVSGILLEGFGCGDRVAIGVGVNVAAHPDGLPYPAAHFGAYDHGIDRDRLFAALAEALSGALDAFDAGGFAPIRRRWLERAAHLGGMIGVRRASADAQGRFRDLDEDGRLLLDTTAGPIAIDAGDVFPLDKPSVGGQELAKRTMTGRA